MALALEVESIDGLDDGIKSLYVEHDGKFKLDVSGIEDVSGLKSALEHERSERRTLKTTLKTLEQERVDEKEKAAKDSGDWEQLHGSLNEKYNKLLTDGEAKDAKIANREQMSSALSIATVLADNVAGGAQNATILSRDIAARLKFDGEELKVLDKNGGLSANTIEELTAEFKSNPMYSGLLKGNQSSGGGANGGNNSGGAAKTISFSDFNKLDPGPRMEFIQKGGKVIDD